MIPDSAANFVGFGRGGRGRRRRGLLLLERRHRRAVGRTQGPLRRLGRRRLLKKNLGVYPNTARILIFSHLLRIILKLVVGGWRSDELDEVVREDADPPVDLALPPPGMGFIVEQL